MAFEGPAIAGLRMIWTGLRWIFQRNKAPWSAADARADLLPTAEEKWFRCELTIVNDKHFPLEIMGVRTAEPERLQLRRPDSEVGQPVIGSEADQLNIKWIVRERTDRASELKRRFFICLDGVNDKQRSKGIIVQLEARLRDNRRQQFPVLVRTNAVK